MADNLNYKVIIFLPLELYAFWLALSVDAYLYVRYLVVSG